jgi:hypothetical protein
MACNPNAKMLHRERRFNPLITEKKTIALRRPAKILFVFQGIMR